MKRIALPVLAIQVLVIIMVLGNGVIAQGNPVIHFSDLINGPKTGNSDGAGGLTSSEHGSIITVWGNNLGSSQGSSNVYFRDSLDNVHEAAHVYYWTNADGQGGGGPSDLYTYHRMQEIAFSIPAAVSDGPGKIYMTVNGADSNELDFTVRDGDIYFVRTGGSDSGDGSWGNPWETLNYIGEGAGGNVNAGDIIYIGDGVTETGGFAIKISGTSPEHIALVAYPGAGVHFSGRTITATIFNWYQSNGYWDFSKLSIDTDATGIGGFSDMRVVGVEITGPNADGYGGSIGCGEGSQEAVDGTCGGGKFYGLYIHDFGNDQTSEFHHTTYMSNRDGLPNKAYEYGWCYLRDNKAVHGFHIYDQTPFGDWTGVMKIHDNVVVNQKGPAVNLMGGSGITVPLEVYNNLFINCGIGPDINGWPVPKYAILLTDSVASPVKIYNNVIYGYGDGSGAAVANAFSGTLEFRNNIIVDTKDIAYFVGSPDTNSNNIFYNGGDGNPSAPAWAINPITSNPLFVDPGNNNFYLQPTSPAIEGGTSVVSSVVTRDLIGTPRPQGSGYDIGAHEYSSGTPPQPCTGQGYYCCLSGFTCSDTRSGSGCGSGETCCASSGACTPPPIYQCSDGLDNDGDTLIDYPDDPGCTSDMDDDETDAQPYFLPGQYVEAEDGELTSPVQTAASASASGGYYIYSGTTDQGSAKFTFSIQTGGKYTMNARILTPDLGDGMESHNSFYIGLDGHDPQASSDEEYTYDAYVSSSFAWDNVSLRGPSGNFTWSEFDPMEWDLSQGLHTFTYYAREQDTWLDQIILRKAAIHPADTSGDGCISLDELLAYIDLWKTPSGGVAMPELMEAIGLWNSGTGCQ
jgi:hypothetical protein